jgi:hypothetical protein
MGNRVSQIYDDDLVLRDSGTAITTTTSETGIEFAVRHIGGYKAVIQYNGMDFTTGDETYVFSIEVSDLVGGTYTAIATMPDIGSATASGRLDVPLSGKIAEELDADSAFIRVTATLGGTTPSIDYDCYLTKM